MTELELAQYTTDVTRWVAYFGFALWGAAGWYVGRFFLKKNYIKPTGLINMKVVRQIENDNFEKNGEITELKKQIGIIHKENNRLLKNNEKLGQDNKSLWYWSHMPHSKAHFITVKQQDKDGEEVALSQTTLPEKEHWVEPPYYADDRDEDFRQWKDSLPHNKEKKDD